MTARERILMIRLAEKLQKHPAFAEALGIEATGAANNQKRESDQKGPRRCVRPFAHSEGR